MAQPNNSSMLSRIPPELRNMIYSLVLRRDEPIMIRPWGSRCDIPARMKGKMMKLDATSLANDGDAIYQKFRQIDLRRETPRARGHCALLRTCRAANEEASPILFRANRLVIDDPFFGRDWALDQGPRRIMLLREISLWIRASRYGHPDWLDLLMELEQASWENHRLRVKLMIEMPVIKEHGDEISS
ncbi:Uu.00g022770.m01.CDS01 [Anthostomella pinea]|uniref:Uu.00g022770.m01.CDS01 n=1 Tax=Anthostomella pinea TaxID=933095 RepID=A0AAI8W153_9PEZI|nr:Uu.00g022770.m01.CDS01 [Anthostomella pinea]